MKKFTNESISEFCNYIEIEEQKLDHELLSETYELSCVYNYENPDHVARMNMLQKKWELQFPVNNEEMYEFAQAIFDGFSMLVPV